MSFEGEAVGDFSSSGANDRGYKYCAFNLDLSSQLEIPGAKPSENATADFAPAITVVLGDALLAGQLRPWGPYTVSADGLLFDRSGVARYACTAGGARVAVEIVDGVDQSAVADYLIATALPAALWMRGDIVLHAAAASLDADRDAIAFAGASGSGKSSLLHELLQHGASIVAEDTLCLRGQASAFEVSGLPATLLLRRAGNELAADRDAFPVPEGQQQSSAQLAAVVVLTDISSASDTALHRVSNGVALELLLQHRHRATVPHLLGLDAVLLPRFAALARAIPVYLWSRSHPGAALSPDELGALRELVGDDK